MQAVLLGSELHETVKARRLQLQQPLLTLRLLLLLPPRGLECQLQSPQVLLPLLLQHPVLPLLLPLLRGQQRGGQPYARGTAPDTGAPTVKWRGKSRSHNLPLSVY